MEQRKYKIEYSNQEHPKMIMFQDGSIASLLPLADFVKICNESRELVDGKGELVTFTSQIYTDVDELNKYIRLCGRMNDQMGNFFLELKKKGAPIYVPDPKYYNARLEKIKNDIALGRINSEDAALKLNQEFSATLKDAIALNERTASNPKYNVKLPYEKKEELAK